METRELDVTLIYKAQKLSFQEEKKWYFYKKKKEKKKREKEDPLSRIPNEHIVFPREESCFFLLPHP